MGTLLFFSGLVVAVFISEVIAAACSPVYCTARRRNFHIIFAAVVMATQSHRQRISCTGLLAQAILWGGHRPSSGTWTSFLKTLVVIRHYVEVTFFSRLLPLIFATCPITAVTVLESELRSSISYAACGAGEALVDLDRSAGWTASMRTSAGRGSSSTVQIYCCD
ncbi:pogo transposable element with krab domain [Plakobranchus ocellatus]|uniref:Pogo transposable element with krab domain n=1 Tax=Plakobranchus ocellatus TaxID=259542 RepID=A0AAV3YXT8_9GAST|nr:pogo transposable element with krab domain [Plakobranchus ocellatus]